MGHFSGHANAFPQGRVRVDGFANVDGVCAHLNGQSHFTDHVTRMRTHHAAAQDLAVAVSLGRIIKQQLGHAFITAVGNCAA